MTLTRTSAAIALDRYRLDLAGIHGPAHWLRVMRNGRELVARTPGADGAVVDLFAILHDCCRQHDGNDARHGERAAAFVKALVEDGRLHLDHARAELLIAACAGHEHGRVTSDPTIGACWDADRLDLSRLRRRPVTALLSTAAARDPAVQAGAWLRGMAGQIEHDLAHECGLAVTREARRA